MARDRNAPGEETSNRIAGRLDNQLSRRAVESGGEVFSGRLASRALRAVGARAMTVNRAIVVDNEFNINRPEDQALLAHEQYHLEHSGGEAGHTLNDAEEVAARAVEAMVFHRAGGYEGGYTPGRSGSSHPGDASASGENAGVTSSEEKPEAKNARPDPVRGYWAMIEQGYSHQDVVEELARRCLSVVDESAQTGLDRSSDRKGWR